MGTEFKSNEGTVENYKLRRQLAVAVRSIQWSYAIFWSSCKNEQGVLKWCEGCYNGDIKTRKMVQYGIGTYVKADETGVERSEQLRELYNSLLADESEQQAPKAAALSPSSLTSLSPKDLSDDEWYYLICMSFVFTSGQGLPGRALAKGTTIWLCDVKRVNQEHFSRALLVNNTSIQTIVCFPHSGGVIEIGVTDLVPQDLDLLQQFKASLQDLTQPVCEGNSEHRTRNGDDNNKNDEDSSLDLENISSSQNDVRFDQRDGNEKPSPNHEKYAIHSLEDGSNGDDRNNQSEDSQFHISPFKDDSSSLLVKQFLNCTSDCTFDAFANKMDILSSQTLVDLNSAHFSDTTCSLNTGTDDDLHYKKTVAAVLGGSSKFIGHVSFQDGRDSSFVPWKKKPEHEYRPTLSRQNMVKEILFKFPAMYTNCSSLESSVKRFGKNLQSDFNGQYSKSREEPNVLVLRSIVPSINKSNEESVRSNTNKYLRELEERVGELDSRTSLIKRLEIVDQTSDNCATKKMRFNRRKACDAEENDSVRHETVSHEVVLKVRVKKNQEVLIQMKCPYKEYILVDIMDAISRLHLDSRLVQSSTLDGVFTLTLRAKFRGTAIAPVGMIKQALWKVASKC